MATIVLAIALAALSAALLSATVGNEKVHVQSAGMQRAFYAAEAGLSDAFAQVASGALRPEPGETLELGSPDAPRELGSCSYWVAVSPAEDDPRGYQLLSSGSDGTREARLKEIVSKQATGLFQFAAFGSKGVVLDSNSFVDSYDSAYGPYPSQVQGGNSFARENGDIGSNQDIVLKANTDIHGDARPGPGHVVNFTGPNIHVSGSTEPLTQPVPMPPIEVPPIPPQGPLAGRGAVNLGPGDVHYTTVSMSGGSTLTIHGPARIVMDDLTMKSNSNLVFDTSGGPIQLYSLGDFNLQSNSHVATLSNSALDVTLFLNGDNMSPGHSDTIQLGANSEFVGAIYAPQARFSLASNFSIYGSIMAGFLDLASMGEIHFDEALMYDGYGSTGDLGSRFWRPIAAH